MKKRVYKNAVVYITIPNEEQRNNIRKATEVFLKKVVKKGYIKNVYDNTSGNIKKK